MSSFSVLTVSIIERITQMHTIQTQKLLPKILPGSDKWTNHLQRIHPLSGKKRNLFLLEESKGFVHAAISSMALGANNRFELFAI